MSAHIRLVKKTMVLTTAIHVLGGCALSPSSHVDVSTPSDQEFIEFDAQLNVAPATAYQNIFNTARACWCPPFSGQVLAYSGPAANATSKISFVVPGKILGSGVELVTVRLYPQDEYHTRIVGTSFVYPGTWQLAQLADWAAGVTNACSTVSSP